ncbi:MAG: signal peptidase II [Candidatus Omnitrophica bacterium]|nr:signal peptidase II [Candidatus Omnitrophota bacterium]MCM8797991.1 signal peptidase II [Candidatus Omnitrophota bacterium]
MSKQTGERKINPQLVFYLLLALSIFLVDQLIKQSLALSFLPGQGFPIVKKIFHITLVFNRGIAFGLFPNFPLPFLIIGIVTFVLFFFIQNGLNKGSKLAISLISAGTLSNFFDRVRFGYVIDYLDFRIWPVFNLADVAISLSIILLLWQLIKHRSGGRNSEYNDVPHTFPYRSDKCI